MRTCIFSDMNLVNRELSQLPVKRGKSMKIRNRLWGLGVVSLVGCALICLGCHPVKQPAKQFSNEGKTDTGIFGKKTQEIGEFDPNDNVSVSGGGQKQTNPLNPLAPLNAYQPAIEKLAKLRIKQAVDLFHAFHGRYPEDHAEFMDEVIKPNQIQLPVLPGEWKYQYDVENHELVVVKAESKED